MSSDNSTAALASHSVTPFPPRSGFTPAERALIAALISATVRELRAEAAARAA